MGVGLKRGPRMRRQSRLGGGDLLVTVGRIKCLIPFVSGRSTALQALRTNFGLWPKSRHPSARRKVDGCLDFARHERGGRADSTRWDLGSILAPTMQCALACREQFGRGEAVDIAVRSLEIGRAHV